MSIFPKKNNIKNTNKIENIFFISINTNVLQKKHTKAILFNSGVNVPNKYYASLILIFLSN